MCFFSGVVAMKGGGGRGERSMLMRLVGKRNEGIGGTVCVISGACRRKGKREERRISCRLSKSRRGRAVLFFILVCLPPPCTDLTFFLSVPPCAARFLCCSPLSPLSSPSPHPPIHISPPPPHPHIPSATTSS